MTSDLKPYEMFVAGDWCKAEGDERFVSTNPATEEDWAEIPAASEADVDRTIKAAHSAFEEGPWPRTSPTARGKKLRQLAELIKPNAEALGRTETIDTGKLFRETRWQANNVAAMYEFYGGLADKVNGYVPPLAPDQNLMYVTHEPVGVVAAIVPWNTQIQLAANKVGPALAAGNSVVVKASEHASAAMLEFAAIVAELDLPPGTFNVITGLGEPCGRALTAHPNVDRISFTGGVETARRIIPSTANNIAKLSLELGGKSPVVVFDDADLESAVNGVLAGIFGASGQSCAAGSRLILQAGVYDEMLSRLKTRAEEVVVGDPLNEATQMGPLATVAQRDRAERIVQQSLDQGARLVTGGGRPSGLDKGWYYEPTILECDDQSLPCVQTELFAPILSVLKFKNEAEAVALANGTEFAFAGGVFTRDSARGIRMARAIRAGRIWVNTYRRSSVLTPFGGFRNSGYGREAGIDAIRDFTETKGTMIEVTGQPMADPFIMG
ncbi:MAG: aldehyde dehydrogenase [Pseudomonadota bacterium]